MVSLVCVQTGALNHPALALYHSLGFTRSETATLYRRPGSSTGRSLGEAT
jgi:hypothetical protein